MIATTMLRKTTFLKVWPGQYVSAVHRSGREGGVRPCLRASETWAQRQRIIKMGRIATCIPKSRAMV